MPTHTGIFLSGKAILLEKAVNYSHNQIVILKLMSLALNGTGL
jgi:hypothetical protein